MIFPVITDKEKQLPIYITGIGIQKEQEPTFRPHGFNHHQWTFCTKGKGIFTCNNEEKEISEGMGFYFMKGVPHNYMATQEPWETLWINYSGDSCLSIMALLGMKEYGTFKADHGETENAKIIHRLFLETYGIIQSPNIERVIDSVGHLYQLLLTVKNAKVLHIENDKHIGIRKLEPVISYMEAQYSRDISLDELAKVAGVTSYYLCRLFKNIFGISPIHYLIRIRLQAAKTMLLVEPDKSIEHVANAVSYRDTSYFCAIFKKQEQVTPSQFRGIHGL